jgi:Neural proliferation differentiation control-1 protein (NPDC1)
LCCRLRKANEKVKEVEYTAYGSTGTYQPAYGISGDRKMAQSAQMFHYQHQKQQMLELEK